jgi:hypothetical protein
MVTVDDKKASKLLAKDRLARKELPVKVWALADVIWVAAKTKKSAIKSFVKHGCEKEFCEARVRCMTDSDLIHYLLYDECDDSSPPSGSFAAELARQLEKGTKLPFVLAESE